MLDLSLDSYLLFIGMPVSICSIEANGMNYKNIALNNFLDNDKNINLSFPNQSSLY